MSKQSSSHHNDSLNSCGIDVMTWKWPEPNLFQIMYFFHSKDPPSSLKVSPPKEIVLQKTTLHYPPNFYSNNQKNYRTSLYFIFIVALWADSHSWDVIRWKYLFRLKTSREDYLYSMLYIHIKFLCSNSLFLCITILHYHTPLTMNMIMYKNTCT